MGRRIRSSNNNGENSPINKGNNIGQQLAYLKQLTNQYNYIKQQQHSNALSSGWNAQQQSHVHHPQQGLSAKNSYTWINSNEEGNGDRKGHDGVEYELVENGFPYQENPARSGYQPGLINNEILNSERTVFSVPELYINQYNRGQLAPNDLIRR